MCVCFVTRLALNGAMRRLGLWGAGVGACVRRNSLVKSPLQIPHYSSDGRGSGPQVYVCVCVCPCVCERECVREVCECVRESPPFIKWSRPWSTCVCVCVCVRVCVCVHAPMCDNVIGRSASEWMSELCLRVCRNQCLKVPGEVL